MGRGWRTSARFLTYGGWPADPTDEQSVRLGRLPGFARGDIRLEKRWSIGETGFVSFVVEVLNMTGSKDVTARRCSPVTGCEDRAFGPLIVPSIGVEGGL
jgi:hypothetical protein